MDWFGLAMAGGFDGYGYRHGYGRNYSKSYSTEYAKSGRSTCNRCRIKIPNGDLRLATVTEREWGPAPSWYHFDCFFDCQSPKSTNSIEGFQDLVQEDKDRINQMIENKKAAPKKTKRGKKTAGKKKEESLTEEQQSNIRDYAVEYARSDRSQCYYCLEKIPQGDVRISLKTHVSEVAISLGRPIDMWYHVDCFKENREEIGLKVSIDNVLGYRSLTSDDQEKLLKKIPAMVPKKKVKKEVVDLFEDNEAGPSKPKKIKKEPVVAKERENNDANVSLTYQHDQVLYMYREELKALSMAELKLLLEFNGQLAPLNEAEMLEMIADIMTYGALLPCPSCKTGQLVYQEDEGYICGGDMKSEWITCPNKTSHPQRRPVRIPQEMVGFLRNYVYVPRERLVPLAQSIFKSQLLTPKTEIKVEKQAVKVKTEIKSEKVKVKIEKVQKVEEPEAGTVSLTAIKTEKFEGVVKMEPMLDDGQVLPLMGFAFVLDPKLERPKEEISKIILKLGGKVYSNITSRVNAMFSTKENVMEQTPKMKRAEAMKLPVLPLEILLEIEADATLDVALLLRSKDIAPWNEAIGVAEEQDDAAANGELEQEAMEASTST